ncbi:hypothetical protein B0H14DRAFT_3473990 [Mycena olivaceomarginata]|nr:hypothetical protein B0H14DRAFT_3473990 [Mycena olivaceomarginata]
MRVEIGSQAWEFKDATRISRMLSPKIPRRGGSLNLLSDYECEVDNSWFEAALNAATTELGTSLVGCRWPCAKRERHHFKPLARFLNACVKCGGDALAGHRGAWYTNLHFVVYDEEVRDGGGGAPIVQPGLAGVVDPKPARCFETDVLHWRPPDSSKEGHRMQLPVAVNNDWLHILSQANTYALALFDMNPSRTFALVPAYNHHTHELRFLIFHRGGLTSHAPLNLSKLSGRVQALRLIMTILLWSEPCHASFVSISNDFEYLIPQSSQSGEKTHPRDGPTSDP